MITSLKQRKIKPGIKLNHNKYTIVTINLSWYLMLSSFSQSENLGQILHPTQTTEGERLVGPTTFFSGCFLRAPDDTYNV